MSNMNDRLERLAVQDADGGLAFAAAEVGASQPAARAAGAIIVRFGGFDRHGQPLVTDVPALPGQMVTARATVPLRREMIGSEVLVLCEAGEPSRPIIVGALEPARALATHADASCGVSVQSDGVRVVISAEREIVLRCGDASITLTRAGKVLINGTYILSRSTGYIKLKGSAIDIN